MWQSFEKNIGWRPCRSRLEGRHDQELSPFASAIRLTHFRGRRLPINERRVVIVRVGAAGDAATLQGREGEGSSASVELNPTIAGGFSHRPQTSPGRQDEMAGSLYPAPMPPVNFVTNRVHVWRGDEQAAATRGHSVKLL